MLFAPFDQSDLLRGETHPAVRGGICVALCDQWLKLIRSGRARTPEERLAELRHLSPEAKRRQIVYSLLRPTYGRLEARRRADKPLGLDFTEKTQVTPHLHRRPEFGPGQMQSLRAMERFIAADLALDGAAATWTMEIPNLGRHAIAGYRGAVKRNVATFHLGIFLFDPNVGEFFGTPQELPQMLRALCDFAPGRAYDRITDFARAEVQERDPYRFEDDPDGGGR
ncbi:MAG: hypothetical protein NZM27_04740 [Acetobacteraceae bacterium]|nr:hypothetical protein [Acetobacteraceae bacterium]MDW8399351.1 hypothetical protein [Acetobacteraceae bacterium]